MRLNLRFIIAIIVAAVSLFGYYFNTSKNEVTGETQHISMSADQEIALGLQAAPEMAQQHGGLSSDTQAAQKIKEIGQKIVAQSAARSARCRRFSRRSRGDWSGGDGGSLFEVTMIPRPL